MNFDPILGLAFAMIANTVLLIFKIIWDHLRSETKENATSSKNNSERITRVEVRLDEMKKDTEKIPKLKEDVAAAHKTLREVKNIISGGI